MLVIKVTLLRPIIFGAFISIDCLLRLGFSGKKVISFRRKDMLPVEIVDSVLGKPLHLEGSFFHVLHI
jgi:hypothetical protein